MLVITKGAIWPLVSFCQPANGDEKVGVLDVENIKMEGFTLRGNHGLLHPSSHADRHVSAAPMVE